MSYLVALSWNIQKIYEFVYLTTISVLCPDKVLAPPGVLAIGLVVLKSGTTKTGTVRTICQLKFISTSRLLSKLNIVI
jgi:hypothetical protein